MAKHNLRPDHNGTQRAQFESNKKKIYATQTICGICGKPVDFGFKFPHPLSPCIDHIIPVSKGGHPSALENLQLAHMCCNRQKSDKLVEKQVFDNGTVFSAGNLTMHRYFSPTLCPGPYLASRFKYIAEQVNKQLNTKPSKATTVKNAVNKVVKKVTFKPYKVQVVANTLNIRKGAGTNYAVTGTITNKGIYTITAEKSGTGASKWGKLKSGAGWISLDWVKKV